jgi:hypothetical protein
MHYQSQALFGLLKFPNLVNDMIRYQMCSCRLTIADLWNGRLFVFVTR